MLSPIYSDLKGFPPTLFITSTRDLLLSGTTDLHRAFLRAGVDAELVVLRRYPTHFGMTISCRRRKKLWASWPGSLI